jgi:hypothetical protein
MTKAPVKVVAKALACVSAKVVVLQSIRPLKNFSSVALQHGHAGALAITGTAFGVTCVPRPEQLVRSTPLLPCGMPKDAGRGLACAREAGLDFSEVGTFRLR